MGYQMNNNINGNQLGNKIIIDAENQLKDINPSPFSIEGFATLKNKIKEYINDLINESIKASKRNKADTVSVFHVEYANNYLITSSSTKKHIGTIGGVLLGASISNLISILGIDNPPTIKIILSSLIGMAGTAMIFYYIGSDRSK
jgi:hypothetical protein